MSKDRKSLLVLGASRYQLDVILAAKSLGYRVVSSDNVPTNPGHAVADRCYFVDTTDREAILAIAQREGIDAVLASATDVAVPTAAFVAERLGLKGPPYESTLVTCDKLAFRRFLSEHGFPSPLAEEVHDGSSPRLATNLEGRWIVKPNRASGSKGVFIVDSASKLCQVLPETLSHSRDGRALVEQYIQGFQGTIEGVLRNGEIVHAFFLDRQTVAPPYVATCGHHVPSLLPARLQRRAMDQLAELWRLLRVREGPFDCDFVATDDEIYLLEATPRLGGNSIARLLRAAAGVDLVEYAVLAALARSPVELGQFDLRPTALVLLGAPEAGVLRYEKSEVYALMREPWVLSIEMDLEPGAWVDAFKNGRHRVGEAIVTEHTRRDVDRRVVELRRRLNVRAVASTRRR